MHCYIIRKNKKVNCMLSKSEKGVFSVSINKSTYKDFSHTVLDKYGHIYGHLSESFEEALKLWIEKEKANAQT